MVLFPRNMRQIPYFAPALALLLCAVPATVSAARDKPAPPAATAPASDPDPVPPVPITDPAPGANNAYTLYVQAIQAIKDTRFDNPNLALSDDDKQEIIDKNVEAFQFARDAEKYPFQAPPIRTFDIDFSSFDDVRSLARLLRFRSELQAQQGKWPESAASALDAVTLGVKVQQGGPLIQILVGSAVESIGRKPLADAIPHLDSKSAIAVAARLKEIEAERPSFASVLKEEEIASEASALEIMRDPKQWSGFVASAKFTGTPPSRQAVLDSYVKYMGHAIDAAGKPYAPQAKPPTHDPGLDQMESVGDPIYRVKFEADRADNALMIVQLALQAYRKDNGVYPNKLLDLVPGDLPSLPADPFSPSNSIRYVRTGSAYILYSVGPDGKDNGGAPIDDPSLDRMDSTGRLRHIVTVTSKGDIVAGVNTF